MEIVIGATQSLGMTGKKNNNISSGGIEARLLSVRPPRKGIGSIPTKSDDRRGRPHNFDPANSRVLTLLVSDISELPHDIISGNYKVMLRFVQLRK